MNIDEILDVMDEFLEKSWNLPLSGGKSVVDADKIRQMIDDIRLSLPSEIKQAKMIVSDRQDIIKNARKEADDIIKKAEAKAKSMVDNDEIVTRAREQAKELVTMAQSRSHEMKTAAVEFSDNLMRTTEECMVQNLKQIKEAKEIMKKSRLSSGRQGNQ